MKVKTEYQMRTRNGCTMRCDLTIMRRPGYTVVVASERPDNEGRSVTNAADELALSVCVQFGIDPRKLVWIEHYPSSVSHDLDTFDMVTFKAKITPKPPMQIEGTKVFCGRFEFIDPQWRTMSDYEWSELQLDVNEIRGQKQ